ncbi:MAG TPA: hypothetical protein VFD36_30775 [Kofleriaceae bacterium]|nr:hypothetical protein [Kofleriaceae bacterium]
MTLTLRVAALTLVACKSPPEPPPLPPHDGVTLIHRGVPPFQPLRYHLARGTRTTSQLICDLELKTDGERGPIPALVVDLDTTVEDVLADGSARLRVTIARTTVRDRSDSPVDSDVVLAQAAALQGVAIVQTLAPDGQLADSYVDAAGGAPESARDDLDRLSRSLQQVAMRMPAESVGVGAIWRERRTLPEGGIRATSETLYTLTSLTGSTIEYTSMGLSSGPPQTVDQDGVKVEVTSTRGHAEAKGSVDLSRFAFNAKSSSTFSTTMNVVAPNVLPGAGPSTIEITMAIEVSSAPSPGNASPPAPMTAANAPSPAAPASDNAAVPTAANGIASQATAAGPDAVSSAAAPGDGKSPPPTAAATGDGKASPAAATATTDGKAPPATATSDGKAPAAAAAAIDGKAPTPTPASPGDSKASPPPTAATTGTPPHATGHAEDDHGAHSAP